MTPLEDVTTVFFDLGGTLLRVVPTVGAAYAQVAARHGVRARAEEVEESFRAAWRRSRVRSAERDHVCSDEILLEDWRLIVRESFGDALPPAKLDVVFEELYGHFAAGRAWVVADGALETLRRLRERGLKLAIVSNWDSRVEQTLGELGLSGLFDELIVSHAVGVEKPHPEIFRVALATTGARPASCLHVGDSLDADIRPARALGMQTLWVTADLNARDPEGPTAYGFSRQETFWRKLLDDEG